MELCRRAPKIVIEVDWDELTAAQVFDDVVVVAVDVEDTLLMM